MVKVTPGKFLRQASTIRFQYMRILSDGGKGEHIPTIDGAWSSRVRKRHCISLRRINVRWKVSKYIMDERMRISWSNLVKVRALILAEFGYDPVIYSFDQKPFHMNEAGCKESKTLSFKNVETVCRENHTDTRSRWTGNTLCVNDIELARKIPFAQLMFNGGSGILKDLKELETELRATGYPWLSLTTSDSGSYRIEHVVEYLEELLDEMTPGRRIRILMCDAYKAHLDPAIRRLAWSRGYIVVYQGGGTTGIP